MMQVLSEEESLKLEQKTDKWLLGLDWNTKFRLRALLDPFYQQLIANMSGWIQILI